MQDRIVSKRSKQIHIVITLAVMLLIFVHSAMPGEMSGAESRYFAELFASITGLSIDAASFIVRKMAHFTEYAVLGGCLLLDMRDFRLKVPALAAWLAGVFYAVTDEFHQRFVAGRSCELRDVCIDAAGVAVGILITNLVIYLHNHHRSDM